MIKIACTDPIIQCCLAAEMFYVKLERNRLFTFLSSEAGKQRYLLLTSLYEWVVCILQC